MTDGRAALVWGVKQSFRNYVEAVGGASDALAGAERSADGAFVFPARPDGGLILDAEGALSGRGGFVGQARFAAHGGMLSVVLADPAVEIGPSGAILTVADSPAGDRRVAIARLDVAGATRGEDGEIVIPAALTIEGSQVLGDHYPPSTALDPVRLRLTAT